MISTKELGIIIKSPQEIALMRRAGKVVAETQEVLIRALRAGMHTRELDDIATEAILSRGAQLSFKGYRGFPASICVSINEEVVHGIPGNRVIHEGDVVSLDVGAVVEGFQADGAVTVGVGEITPEAQRLIETTRESLEEAIKVARPGARLSDISAAVQRYVEERSYAVVREYVGHGIGRSLHEDPQIPNYGPAGRGPVLRKGMALAIEPMVNLGTWKTRVKPDMWTVVTEDGRWSAHFEHTIAITDDGAQVLTKL